MQVKFDDGELWLFGFECRFLVISSFCIAFDLCANALAEADARRLHGSMYNTGAERGRNLTCC